MFHKKKTKFYLKKQIFLIHIMSEIPDINLNYCEYVKTRFVTFVTQKRPLAFKISTFRNIFVQTKDLATGPLTNWKINKTTVYS